MDWFLQCFLSNIHTHLCSNSCIREKLGVQYFGMQAGAARHRTLPPELQPLQMIMSVFSCHAGAQQLPNYTQEAATAWKKKTFEKNYVIAFQESRLQHRLTLTPTVWENTAPGTGALSKGINGDRAVVMCNNMLGSHVHPFNLHQVLPVRYC